MLAGCGAVLASSVLSGCSVLNSGSGGSGRSAYTDWSYDADVELVGFSYFQYAEIAGIDGLPDDFMDDEILGIPIEEFDHRVAFDSHSVIQGSFSADEFRTGLEDSQDLTLQEADERSGYQFYSIEGQSSQIGFRDGSVVIGPSETMDTFLGAGTGEVDSLVDVNDDFDEFTDELGADHSVNGRVKLSSDARSFSMTEAQLARGSTTEYGPDVTESTRVVLFESEDAVDEESVKSNFEGRESVSDVSASTDGRVVTVTYTRPTEDLVN